MKLLNDRWSRRELLKGLALGGTLGLIDVYARPIVTHAWQTQQGRSLFDFMPIEQQKAIIRGDVVDCTEALRQFFHDAVLQRGGTYFIPPYTFYFAISNEDILGKLYDVSNYTLLAYGSTLYDRRNNSSYQSSTKDNSPTLIEFRRCQDIDIQGLFVDSVDVVGQPYGGLNVLRFKESNSRIRIMARVSGCLHGVWFDGVRFSSVRTVDSLVTLDAKRCYYPLLAEDSGDYLRAQVFADYCGRPIFIHG
jgi:hypothetical protein